METTKVVDLVKSSNSKDNNHTFFFNFDTITCHNVVHETHFFYYTVQGYRKFSVTFLLAHPLFYNFSNFNCNARNTDL
jgi:hypothetical protein